MTVQERRGGLRAIAAEIPRIAATALGKRGFGEAQLVTQWEAVMGPELAAKLAPDRLNFARGERAGGTLRLRVASAFATEAQHLEPVLIERINSFFGYGAVAPIQADCQAAPPPRPLSDAERADLAQRVATVPEGDLRDALARLGASVIGSNRS
jgi:hypothetical protein